MDQFFIAEDTGAWRNARQRRPACKSGSRESESAKASIVAYRPDDRIRLAADRQATRGAMRWVIGSAG